MTKSKRYCGIFLKDLRKYRGNTIRIGTEPIQSISVKG